MGHDCIGDMNYAKLARCPLRYYCADCLHAHLRNSATCKAHPTGGFYRVRVQLIDAIKGAEVDVTGSLVLFASASICGNLKFCLIDVRNIVIVIKAYYGQLIWSVTIWAVWFWCIASRLFTRNARSVNKWKLFVC